MPIDALSVLCAQLMPDLFAIAKFLFMFQYGGVPAHQHVTLPFPGARERCEKHIV